MQTWHKKGKGWLLVEEARLRGPDMPGLYAPPTTDDKALDKAVDKAADKPVDPK